MKLSPFNETLYRELHDPAFAFAYLWDALKDSPREFIVALRKCIKAHAR